MSETKFRAIYKPDIDIGKPMYFYQQRIDDGLWFVCESDPEIKYDFQTPFLDDDWILEQSTGLKDKNRKEEIYHKDIVEVGGVRFVVNWNEYYCAWTLSQDPDGNDWSMLSEYIEDGYLAGEIIGNVADNPELLETPA